MRIPTHTLYEQSVKSTVGDEQQLKITFFSLFSETPHFYKFKGQAKLFIQHDTKERYQFSHPKRQSSKANPVSICT